MARGLILKGITTDGSPQYPESIVAFFGEIPHKSSLAVPGYRIEIHDDAK